MKGRGLPFVAGLLLLTLGVAGCSLQSTAAPVSGPVHFTDDLGTVVSLKAPVTRIVSLGPSNTEILLAMGLKSDLVGADDGSFKYLPAKYKGQIKGLKDVGDATSTPNLEAIRALHPGLVLAIWDSPYVKKIRSLGIPVAVLDPTTMAGIEKDIQDMGVATGDPQAAKSLLGTMTKEITAIVAAAKKAGPAPTVFVELDPTLYTAGHGSLVDDLVRLANGKNVGDQMASTPYPQVTSEQVVAANPQVIVLLDGAYGGTPAAVSARPGWDLIAAVKNHRVVTSVDASLLSQPGPDIVTGLLELAQALHPGMSVVGIGTTP